MHDPNETKPRRTGLSPLIPTGDSELVAQEACRAANGALVALRDLQRSLVGVFNPLRMVRHHPVGTVLSVGAIAAVGTAGVRTPCGRARTKSAISGGARWLRRAVTGVVFNTILSRIVLPMGAECARTEDGSGPGI